MIILGIFKNKKGKENDDSIDLRQEVIKLKKEKALLEFDKTYLEGVIEELQKSIQGLQEENKGINEKATKLQEENNKINEKANKLQEENIKINEKATKLQEENNRNIELLGNLLSSVEFKENSIQDIECYIEEFTDYCVEQFIKKMQEVDEYESDIAILIGVNDQLYSACIKLITALKGEVLVDTDNSNSNTVNINTHISKSVDADDSNSDTVGITEYKNKLKRVYPWLK